MLFAYRTRNTIQLIKSAPRKKSSYFNAYQSSDVQKAQSIPWINSERKQKPNYKPLWASIAMTIGSESLVHSLRNSAAYCSNCSPRNGQQLHPVNGIRKCTYLSRTVSFLLNARSFVRNIEIPYTVRVYQAFAKRLPRISLAISDPARHKFERT